MNSAIQMFEQRYSIDYFWGYYDWRSEINRKNPLWYEGLNSNCIWPINLKVWSMKHTPTHPGDPPTNSSRGWPVRPPKGQQHDAAQELLAFLLDRAARGPQPRAPEALRRGGGVGRAGGRGGGPRGLGGVPAPGPLRDRGRLPGAAAQPPPLKSSCLKLL
ncbi:unnamed protein product [Heterosigma akashiwo]